MIEDNESIKDKLRSLGVHLGSDTISTKAKPTRYKIEDVIDVINEETPFGSILVYEQQYPIDYLHGRVSLDRLQNFKWISRWAGLSADDNAGRESLLFLDTETSGLTRGTGTFAFLIGLGYFNKDGFCVKQLIMQDPYLEPALLAVLTRVADHFEYVVTYNGKSFDLPLLENRHLMHRIPSPFKNTKHIDLLHLARKLWRNRLQSRRLGDLETHILSFERTNEDIPGWLVPEIYKDYINTGDARPLTGVFYHNIIDILSLAGVFVYVSDLLNDPSTHNTIELDQVAIGNIFEDMGSIESAKEIYQQCLDRELPNDILIQTIKRFAAIFKKAGDWQNAEALWKTAAPSDVDACVELAKYYEHQRKEYHTAIEWTEHAIDICMKDKRNQLLVLEELEHRLKRLLSKQENKG
jgi:uncharacterized protein YprB with RNaseH-like and TPR domain